MSIDLTRLRCSDPRCEQYRHSQGPYCRDHGCRICGDVITPELAHMAEPLCVNCYDDAKAVPRMKKPPKVEGMEWRNDMLFHEAISVDADKLGKTHLERKVLPGLMRSDGKPFTVKEFKSMCAEARARGWQVLPPCAEINNAGQCRGHMAPKVDIKTVIQERLAN